MEGGDRHAVTAIDWSPHDRYRFVSGDERGNTFVWDVRDACSPIKVLGGERYTHLHSRSGNVRLKIVFFFKFLRNLYIHCVTINTSVVIIVKINFSLVHFSCVNVFS